MKNRGEQDEEYGKKGHIHATTVPSLGPHARLARKNARREARRGRAATHRTQLLSVLPRVTARRPPGPHPLLVLLFSSLGNSARTGTGLGRGSGLGRATLDPCRWPRCLPNIRPDAPAQYADCPAQGNRGWRPGRATSGTPPPQRRHQFQVPRILRAVQRASIAPARAFGPRPQRSRSRRRGQLPALSRLAGGRSSRFAETAL